MIAAFFSEESLTAVIVAVIGAVAVWQGKRSRRVESKVDKALSSVDTGNETDIGTTVHDLAQTTELISAQVHLNTKEIVAVARKADLAAEHAEHAAERTIRVDQKVDQHLQDSQAVHEAILESLTELKGDTP